MLHNIYFTPSNIETVAEALKMPAWRKAKELRRKFNPELMSKVKGPGLIIQLSAQEIIDIKSLIVAWYVNSDEPAKGIRALHVLKSMIEDMAEPLWEEQDVEIH